MVHDKDTILRFVNPPKMKLENPVDRNHENPWCFISFKEFAFAEDDFPWQDWFDSHPEALEKFEEYTKQTSWLLRKVKDRKTFLELLKDKAKCMPSTEMFAQDYFWQFRCREVIGDGRSHVENPAGLMHDNAETTVVKPSAKGDIELAYDLGEQNCGYFSLDLTSEAGVVLDIFGIEHIDKNGNLQHTTENRNGVRYITKQGHNQFVSCERRSSRFIYITIRNQKKPIQIHKIDLIESIYPVNHIGSFECSDARLSRIWDISERTLKLCMEDTFVDCPAYEQLFWVGDARNEALFAYYTFGAMDIAKRGMKIAAESLERYPLVGCQLPTSWDSIIPVWSFLWGISIWDYYWYSADEKFLTQMWKSIIKNLKNAESYINEDGLFSASMWNLFDWADIDHGHDTVLHNGLFMVGAIDAALNCAKVIGDSSYNQWLRKMRKRLCKAINKLWDPDKKAYPDSVHKDGKVSESICQHTSFLSVLYDVIEKKNYQAANSNITDPPRDMITVAFCVPDAF